MKNKINFSLIAILALLTVVLIASMFFVVSIGSVDLSISKISEVIFNQLKSNTPINAIGKGAEHDIIWILRLPRIVLAIFVGAGLSVCGVVMQAIVKNPLADPYILGVSSGASLGATAAILLGVGASLGNNYIGISAFIGAFFISLAVLFISNIGGRSNSIKLLLAGMALSAMTSSFSSLIIYFANDREGIESITYWLMGSLAGASWEELIVVGPIVLIAILFFWTQSRILNMMLFGDETAITLGRDLHKYRQVYLLVSSIIVGFAVYSAGMIGFVGLIIPHIVRIFVGTDHNKLLPISALLGAIFLVLADGLCRSIIPKTELPIGLLVSLIGGPVFVYLMVKKTYGFGGSN